MRSFRNNTIVSAETLARFFVPCDRKIVCAQCKTVLQDKDGYKFAIRMGWSIASDHIEATCVVCGATTRFDAATPDGRVSGHHEFNRFVRTSRSTAVSGREDDDA